MRVKTFYQLSLNKDVDVCLRHNNHVYWTGKMSKMPGRYRNYKIKSFYWDDFAWYYDIEFYRDDDIIVKEVK